MDHGHAVALVHWNAQEDVSQVAVIDLDGLSLRQIDAVPVIHRNPLGPVMIEDRLCRILIIRHSEIDLADFARIGQAAVLQSQVKSGLKLWT